MHMNNRASLNHVFRTVWNKALGAMVAVAEIATSAGGSGTVARVRGKAALQTRPQHPLQPLALLMAVAFTPALQNAHAQALPQGAVAVHGSVSTNYSQPGKLVVTTSNGAGTQHSATNWNSFSIGAGATTQINQPSAASMSVNRVVTNTPSQLFGTLQSNGKVVLVNQSGIAVGAGALVDTAGFTASTVGMTTADAIAGRLRFAGGDFSTNAGALTVAGNIVSRGGDVVLIAPNIDIAKTALVEAQNGSVSLAAGQSVEITGRGLEGITLQVQAPADRALNLGSLKGDAVGIFAGTLKHSGLINAVQADGSGGKVVLRAKGNADVEGNAQVLARGDAAGAKGGSVDVLGNVVWVGDNSLVDVAGQAGGGQVRVGGDYKGKNPDVPNAQVAWLGPQAQIKADALDNGNGGRVIVWADDTTRAHGSITAKGGAHGGDGGFVETSGHKYLSVSPYVDTSAANGQRGTWLLDPNTIRIVHALSGGDIRIQNGSSGIGDTRSPLQSDSSESLLSDFTLNLALLANNVWVFTAGSGNGTGVGDIIFDGGLGPVVVNNSSLAARNLTLTADGTVRFTNGNTVFQSPNPASSLNVKLNGNFGANTDVGSTVNLNGSGGFGNITATVDTTRTWTNNGLLTIDGNAAVQLNQGFGASNFINAGTGVVNVNSNTGWAFTSIPTTQDSNIFNNGVFNVTAGTAFEAYYAQGPTGTLKVKDVNLNLQNAGTIQGTVDLMPFSLGASVPATLNINENHGNVAVFGNTNFTSNGSVFVEGGAAVQFIGVTAPLTAMHVGVNSSGILDLMAGNNTFNSLTMGPSGTFSAMSNANLGIKGNGLIIPNIGSLTGNNGFYATGNITVPLTTALTAGGDLTLMASWDGTSTLGAGAGQAATGGTIGLFGNLSLFPNTLNLYAKGAISQGSGFINTSNLTASTTTGSITLGQNNFASGDVNLTSSTGAIAFNDTAGGFNLGGANTAGNLTITTAGAMTADGSISGANVSITAPGGFSTIDQITAQNNLTINTSGGNGIIAQSGFSDFTAPGITVLNAGTGDINLFSSSNNLPTVSLTGGHVDLVTASLMNVTSLTHGSNQNVYLSAGGTLSLPGTPINTTAQVTLSSGGSLSTTALVRGNTVILSAAASLNMSGDVEATSTLNLSTGSGAVNQQFGSTITTPTLNVSGSSVMLPGSGNSIGSLEGAATGGFTVNSTSDLALGNISAGFVAITSGGAITRALGIVDTSNTNGTIALAANSLGTSGSPMVVNPGTGNVQLVAQTGGIYVQQALGDMNLSNYQVSAIGSGQDVWLFGSPLSDSSINVNFVNFNANVIDDKVAVVAPAINGNVLLNGNSLDALQVAIGATGQGGNVTVTSDGSAYSAPLGLDVFSLQGNVVLNGTLHNGSGIVRVTAGDSVTGTGGIRSYGNDVFVTANSAQTGSYGSFVPSGKGRIELSYIHSYGYDGTAGGTSANASGKNGGNITLTVENGTLVSNYPDFVNIRVGQLFSYGGAGQTDTDGAGQAGGHGGTITLVTPFLNGFGGVAKTDGGAGGDSSLSGTGGGSGGTAGNFYATTTANFLNFNGSVSTRGGQGGNAAPDADAGASGGSGGNAGDIFLNGPNGLGFNGLSNFDLTGGAPGLDNNGVGASYSSSTLFLLSGSDISQFVGSSIVAPGQRVRFSADGNINLIDPNNQMGEIDGQAMGDIAIVGLYGIGDPGMRVGSGKNLSLTGLAGTPLQIQGALEAIGGGAAGTVSLTGESIEIRDPITTQNLNLTATTTGGITQFAVGTQATGLTTLAAPAGSTIGLDLGNNVFGTVDANLTGSTLSIATVSGISLGNIFAANLAVQAVDANIMQSAGGAVTVAGNTQLEAGVGHITLMNSGNSFANLNVGSANNLNVFSASSLHLLGIDVAGTMGIQAPSITSSGNVSAGLGNVVMFANAGTIDLKNTSVSAGLQVNLAASSGIDVTNTVFTAGNPVGAAALAISTQGGPLLAAGANISGVAGNWQTFLINPVGGHQFGPFDPVNFATYRHVGFTGAQTLPAGNGSIWFDSGTLSSTLTGSIAKTYDGTTALPGFVAALGSTAFLSAPAYLFGELPADLSAATATLASPNAGSGIGVTMAPVNLDNKIFAANGTPTYGYTLAAAGNIGTVNAAGLDIISLNGMRQYDGTTIVNAGIFNLAGLLNGDTLSLTGFGTLADKNVGVNKVVNPGISGGGGLTLGDGTGLASNYTLGGGTHLATITAKDITTVTGITAVNKTYDGTTAATLNTAAAMFNGKITGDVLAVGSAFGAFTDKNAALGKTVNINGIGLAGSDAGNYNLVLTSASTSANIAKATITGVGGIAVNDKVYDGNTSATLNTGTAGIAGKVAGDDLLVLAANAAFADRNAGNGKTVNINNITIGGIDSGNYITGTYSSTSPGNIAQLPQVNWVGGASGQWSTAGNWAGGALPDGNNVLAVTIPAGSLVTFNAGVGNTQVQNITSLGGIRLTGGNLQVSDTLKTKFYDQSGGLLSGAGKLQVTDGFTKAGGLVNMGGLVEINQTSGNLVVGGIAGGNILLNAANGGITETGPLATTGILAARSAQAMVLNASNNNLDAVVLLADSGNVELTNVGAINLVAVAASNGNIKVNNTGGVVTKGKILAPNGNILIVANSPLTVQADSLVAASGNVDLIATNQTSSGDMLINGLVTSGSNINLGAANNLTQNGQLVAAGGINAFAGGAMTFGPLAISSGNPVNYRANGASVLPPPGSLSELLARSNGTGSFINTFLNKFEEELESQQVAKNDTPGKKKKDDITVEGETCRP